MKIIVATLGGRGYNENYCSWEGSIIKNIVVTLHTFTYIRVHVHAIRHCQLLADGLRRRQLVRLEIKSSQF